MNDICGATITINGQVYSCEVTAGHAGKHVCGVKTGENTYDGFDFGPSYLEIPPDVAAVLFGYQLAQIEVMLKDATQAKKEIDSYARDTLVRLQSELQAYIDRISNSIQALESSSD